MARRLRVEYPGAIGSYVAINNDGSAVFQTVGAGNCYLAPYSPWRAYGTATITPGLLADLRKRTTYPPIVLTNNFTNFTVLNPQAIRDTNTAALDLGWHYDVLDYCWSALNVTHNAILLLTNGLAIANYGTLGTMVWSGSKIIGEGSPTNLNRLVPYNTVQERSVAWGAGGRFSFFDTATDSGPPPEIRLRFTDLAQLANAASGWTILNSQGYSTNTLVLTDCQLRGGYLSMYSSSSNAFPYVAFTNNLVLRTELHFTQGYQTTPYPASLYLRNNLFWGGSASIVALSADSAWEAKDNLFDTVSLSTTNLAIFANSNNGYYQTTALPGGSNNKTLAAVDYQTGPLGNFYYPTTGTNLNSLRDAGSLTNAGLVGLYHYTTTANQVKETNSVLDIGYHLVALNAAGNPLDFDGDGLPNYFEDRNGDGIYDTGDISNWTVADTDGDGMPDGWEFLNGLNPLVNDASDDPDGDGFTNLQEYQNGTNPNDPWLVAWGDQSATPSGLGRILAADGGNHFSVALRNYGTVAAWGDNTYGQTNVPAALSNLVTAVAAAWNQAAALQANGRVTAWGQTFGQIPSDLTTAVGVSLGLEHGIALRADGTVSVWGDPADPGSVSLSGLSGVKAVAAGWEHNAALLNNGTVVAWGANFGGLGWNMTNVPAGLTNVTAIAAGAYHTLALKSDGTVVAWGAGKAGGNYYADQGQSIVPPGLSNVVAIAGGGYDSAALRSDGTVVAWGQTNSTPSPIGLNNVVAIGVADGHSLAERTGRETPLFNLEPQTQCACAGSNVTFRASAIAPASFSYQWQFNNVNIAGATSPTLSLSNVQPSNEGTYRVIISNGAGSTTSQDATLNLCGPPVIASQTQPSTWQLLYGSSLTLSVQATNSGVCPIPISYQWPVSSLPGAFYSFSSNFTIAFANNASAGIYSVVITNGAGSASTTYAVNVAGEGAAVWWGSITQAWNYLPGVTTVIGLAGGGNHTLALLEGGTVLAWGTNSYGQTNVPGGLTNALAVAAGDAHSLALNADGSVVAWGRNDLGQTNVPASVTNTIAISAGGQQSLALRKDGTVVQWGQTFASVPASVTNAIGIASGTNFHLALLTNSTVVAWGNNSSGQLNVPANLSNVVAVAAGGDHALALKVDGSVVAWGNNSSGQTNVPAALTNAMAIAAGYAHSMGLRNDGTVVAWGDNTYGQTNTPNLVAVKLIAAGAYQGLASVFSPVVQYPVDVTKDLLLICNTNSTNSAALRDYYLAHRPLVANANVLNIACDLGEFTTTNNAETQIVAPLLNWLAANPTKHPEYIVLFFDIPTRFSNAYLPAYGSVSYHLQQSYPGWQPFVNYINAGTLADCEAYVDKLANVGTNYSPGKLIISASAGLYGNTNYVLDGIRHGHGYMPPEDFSDYGVLVSKATNGLLANGVASSAILFSDGLETITNGIAYNLPHPTAATNLAGYTSWGDHSSLGGDYATNGLVHWSGNSRWWIIETFESFNGTRATGQGNFIKWLASNAFGGTNYLNTPVGAVTHVEEPGLAGVSDSESYFGLWSAGKNFAISAWNSRKTPWFQAVGEPLVTR
jgi:alpha-tubulin suppressor-like RCC1 family protein